MQVLAICLAATILMSWLVSSRSLMAPTTSVLTAMSSRAATTVYQMWSSTARHYLKRRSWLTWKHRQKCCMLRCSARQSRLSASQPLRKLTWLSITMRTVRRTASKRSALRCKWAARRLWSVALSRTKRSSNRHSRIWKSKSRMTWLRRPRSVCPYASLWIRQAVR